MPTLMFINKESLDAIGNKLRSVLGSESRFSVPSGITNGIDDVLKMGKDSIVLRDYSSSTYEVMRDSTHTSAPYRPYAFAGMSSLSTANVSSQTLPHHCFLDCTALTSVAFKDSNNVVVGGSTGVASFKGCSKLSSIYLSADPIAEEAFSGCLLLNNVAFSSDTLKTIGNEAFLSCSSLATFRFYRVCDIGISAFQGSGLTSVSIAHNSSVTDNLVVGDYAFSDCESLASVSFTGQTRPSALGAYCFQNDTSLTSVTLPPTLTVIPEGCFKGCTSLQSITIPASVQTIGESAFEGCSGLEQVIFENNSALRTIGRRAFYESGLINFTVPSSVMEIESYAFANCSAMDYIRLLPSTPPTAGANMFSVTINNPLTIYVSDSETLEAYRNATNWKISSYKSHMAIWSDNEENSNDD